jgi:hypothetical protein
MFSIYEISSMDTEFVDESNPIIPIANIDTIVIDECNFDTNYNRRYLQTKVMVPKRPKWPEYKSYTSQPINQQYKFQIYTLYYIFFIFRI